MTDFTVVVVENTYATGVSASVDLLRTARELAAAEGAPLPSWRIASPRGGVVDLAPAFSVQTEALDAVGNDRSLWIVPTLAAEGPAQALAPSGQAVALVAAIRAHLARGGQVAASASALLLLAAAGVLAGRRVAASATLAGPLLELEPTARVDSGRILCVDGPITTCSAPLAQSELMLHLLSQFCGPRLAGTLARTWLHPAEQGFPLSNLLPSHESRDTLVAKLVQKVENSLPETPSVAQLASELAVSERTLSRYVRSVTGKSTRALVQDVRLRRARTLLERSRLPVDRVAAAVGYADSTALRRLIKKATGAQPSRFRMACLPA